MSAKICVDLPDWVGPASALPVAFAQVREDPLIDLFVVQRQMTLGRRIRVALVASGGCTAALLAGLEGVEQLHLVDPNIAQLALTRLKLCLLERSDAAARLAVLGHTPMTAESRADTVGRLLGEMGFTPDVLGPVECVGALGADYCGRYEQLFSQLRRELAPLRTQLDAVLAVGDTAEQVPQVCSGSPLGDALERAFDKTFDVRILACLFGRAATANPVEPFARHFIRRTRQVFAAMPAADNPFLWQLLAGRYPPGVTAPWLAQAQRVPVLPEITCSNDVMDEALATPPADGFDVILLSNVLDWLEPDEALVTLERAWHALRPDGAVVIRQLNSKLDVRDCGSRFSWDPIGDWLHVADRSFFYRALHIGLKQSNIWKGRNSACRETPSRERRRLRLLQT